MYIYASLKPGWWNDFEAMRLSRADLPTGVLVGTVEITGCTGKPGDYRWHLKRPQRLKRKLRPKKQPQPALVQSILGDSKNAQTSPNG